MPPETGQKIAYLIVFAVISITVVGYFVGLQSPMNGEAESRSEQVSGTHGEGTHGESESHHRKPKTENRKPSFEKIIPATSYADMKFVSSAGEPMFETSLANLKSTVELTDEVKINPGEKAFALQLRDRNRAFNGAPPTVPHPIDQMSAQSCIACHGEGVKTESLRISKMSHQFLANCTQCHVEQNPQHMPASLFRESTFVGLPAPTEGPRAYAGAPPMIPHSTWMRVDCASCHGPTGLQGIRSTHPWRQNCQQCHAPSSQLEQRRIDKTPQFLSPPPIN